MPDAAPRGFVELTGIVGRLLEPVGNISRCWEVGGKTGVRFTDGETTWCLESLDELKARLAAAQGDGVGNYPVIPDGSTSHGAPADAVLVQWHERLDGSFLASGPERGGWQAVVRQQYGETWTYWTWRGGKAAEENDAPTRERVFRACEDALAERLGSIHVLPPVMLPVAPSAPIPAPVGLPVETMENALIDAQARRRSFPSETLGYMQAQRDIAALIAAIERMESNG